MAKRSIEGSTLTAIADATRNLTGATGLLTPEQIISKLQEEIDNPTIAFETSTIEIADWYAGTIYYIDGQTLEIKSSQIKTNATNTYVVPKNSIVVLKYPLSIGSTEILDGLECIIEIDTLDDNTYRYFIIGIPEDVYISVEDL